LTANDFILTDINNTFDAVVMNPPYLRNEDLPTQNKENWLRNIESSIGVKSFIRNVSQPNLYYYFIEKAMDRLSDNGTGAFILMSKFLNNKDGSPLKQYLTPYLESVIHYPPSFFEGFAVTTDIFIVKKSHRVSEKISFLNIKDTSLLADIGSLKEIIANKDNVLSKQYSLINVMRSEIDANCNWRLYLIDLDMKFEKFSEISNMKPLNSYFTKI
jgi:type I restriction-modification system DNA methylase subunit